MGSTRITKVAIFLILVGAIWALNFNKIEGRLTTMTTSRSSQPGRSLLQAVNVSDDTVRVDPLDNFKKYRGGYDITNKHYWSSTIFTGIHGYAIGVLWLFCGLVYGGFLLATTFCCQNNNRKLKKTSPCQEQSYLWPTILATFITVLAIVATGLVLGGNARFHSKAKTVVNIVIDTANEASETIYNTTGAMKDMSVNLEVSNNGSSQASGFLTSTSQKLDSQAADIQRQAKKNRHAIDKGLRIVYIVTIVTISFNLVAVLVLTAFGILRFRRALKVFIGLCWLLTVLCWLFFGMYFFLEKFEGDTCTALEDFQKDPYNSSLSSILPCNELLSAKSVLSDVSSGIYDLVNEVNTNISTTYPDLIQVCNPFSAPPEYRYQPNNCPDNTIKIAEIPQALKWFTCSDESTGPCVGGLFSANEFRTVEGYTNSIQKILNAYPGMEDLVECQSVEDAFSEILHRHCKPLKRYTRMVWAPLSFLSIIMVALVLIWTVESHHMQEHHFSDGSVKPRSTAAEITEASIAQETKDDSFPNSVV
ncbi:uncharacterized protein LOC130782912 [Actinidia eriantha]|uniref:uncharacterized protein LOC130782912 n=1 Tax=Actinidia eriantha TaxID=165200 RepID=UPI00258C1D97|nr:uncharacterized protein LOC130782912 [Actinidia eriantha]XP_057498357.1 uncharacterized protein LOC130782912 [Actinidia eriantha]